MGVPADGVRLTLYSRNYCHLCEEMAACLRDLRAGFLFSVEIVDVDGDPLLEREHGEKVPLLMHGARELCRYRLDAAAVTAYLEEIR
ncbi:MAG: glutaredoxin family protein [Burkholderiales bacterium]|nr:glutaredoxin family protein [Burkholderiales bacterium]